MALGKDARFACLAIDHDMGLGELFLIGGKIRHADRAGGVEPVALRFIPGGQRAKGEGNGHPVKHAEDSVQGANPQKILAARAHGFGPWKVCENCRDDFGDQLARCAAGTDGPGDVEIPLFIGLDFCFLDARKAGATQKALDRGCGRAMARALFLLGPVGLAVGNSFSDTGKAARTREAAEAGRGKPCLRQSRAQRVLESLPGAFLHPGRDFFGEKLDE